MNPIVKPNFLGYLHSFRGFAILNIVFLHTSVAILITANIDIDPKIPLVLINEVLFHDSTIYFAVISGLLFTAVLKPKGYVTFYKNKLKYLVLPYLFITSLISLIKISFAKEIIFPNVIYDYLRMVLIDFIYGKADFAFWYIPVLIFLYLITPFLDYLLHTNNKTRILFFLIILSPLLVSRIQMAFEYILKIETMIYFSGAYAFGMYVGADLENRLIWIKKYLTSIIFLALLSSLTLAYLYIYNIDKLGVISLLESGFYIQKICISCIVIILFKNIGDKQPIWLSKVAQASFSIYFMHGMIAFGSASLFMFLIQMKNIAPINYVIGAILLLVYTILVSLFIIWIFRNFFGKKSRMLIGS